MLSLPRLQGSQKDNFPSLTEANWHLSNESAIKMSQLSFDYIRKSTRTRWHSEWKPLTLSLTSCRLVNFKVHNKQIVYNLCWWPWICQPFTYCGLSISSRTPDPRELIILKQINTVSRLPEPPGINDTWLVIVHSIIDLLRHFEMNNLTPNPSIMSRWKWSYIMCGCWPYRFNPGPRISQITIRTASFCIAVNGRWAFVYLKESEYTRFPIILRGRYAHARSEC